MKKSLNDIEDNEIRIISSSSTPKKLSATSFSVKEKICANEETESEPVIMRETNVNFSQAGYEDKGSPVKIKRKIFSSMWLLMPIWGWVVLFFIMAGLCLFFIWEVKSDNPVGKTVTEPDIITVNPSTPENSIIEGSEEAARRGFIEKEDTLVGTTRLSIFHIRNAVPELKLGMEALNDSNIVFITQAADLRKDNGNIVGAYVFNGELLSRGQSKAGYCAIINGNMTIGVADATPYLEQAIENEGYFFRQYPLVVGNQVVENKLRYSSLRKALAELNGELVVIMSGKKMTLNEFASVLVELGVSNAIYLIGSTSYGYGVDETGNKLEFGTLENSDSPFINFIVWK